MPGRCGEEDRERKRETIWQQIARSAGSRKRREVSAFSAEGSAFLARAKREKTARLRGDAIINRRDQLNRNGIRAIACAGSIISRTDVQGARGSFNARIGVSIIAISFIRLFFFFSSSSNPTAVTAPLARPFDRYRRLSSLVSSRCTMEQSGV